MTRRARFNPIRDERQPRVPGRGRRLCSLLIWTLQKCCVCEQTATNAFIGAPVAESTIFKRTEQTEPVHSVKTSIASRVRASSALSCPLTDGRPTLTTRRSKTFVYLYAFIALIGAPLSTLLSVMKLLPMQMPQTTMITHFHGLTSDLEGVPSVSEGLRAKSAKSEAAKKK